MLLVLGSAATAQDIKVSVLATSQTVAVGGQFQIQVEVSGGVRNLPDPELPRIDGLDFYPGGTSSSFQFGTGGVQSSKTFTYNVYGKKAGQYKIDGIKVTVGGKTFTGNPLNISVTGAGTSSGTEQQAAPPPQDTSSQALLLRAHPENATAYPNQEIVLTYTLYKHPSVRMGRNINFENLESTLFQGFWQEEVEMRPRSIGNRVIDGQEYEVIELKTIILFPIKPGQFQIDPVGLVCQVSVPQQRRRNTRRSPFDSFFDDSFFNDFLGGNMRGVRIYSNPVTINVEPLPSQGRLASFSGAVGQFGLQASLDKSEVEQGNPITLKVKLSGRGNLRTLPDPELPPLEGLEQFEGTRKEDIQKSKSGMNGKVEYEFVMIPKTEKVNQIGPVRFSYFDPEQKQYKQIQTRPLPLIVHPREQEQQEGLVISGRRRRAVQLRAEDFRHIATDVGNLANQSGYYYTSLTFGAVTVGPWIVVLGTCLWKRRKNRLEAHPVLTRKKRAYSKAFKALRAFERQESAWEKATYYAGLQEVLIVFLEDKFSSELRGMTSDQIQDALVGFGVNEKTSERISSLVRQLEDVRYSPGNEKQVIRKQVLQETQATLKALDSFDSVPGKGNQ